MNLTAPSRIKIVLLVGVILLGFFLRSYHFESWLHFELDQARDARVIDDALVGGPGELTLLGPKAGGTYLRLAPGFYYLEYLSGLLFGATPAGLATFVMWLSVFTLPVFFFFVRRYFSWYYSFLLTMLVSTSAFFVMYGRFAWNPNILPFFVIIGFYALLRSVDHAEVHRGRWFLGAVFALTLSTHAHFLAFLALPAITIAFLLLKRPRFSFGIWVGVCMMVALLYLPMALNEYETGGRNTQEFFHAITEKSTKENHPLIEKVLRNGSEHVLGALVIVTGFERGTFPIFEWRDGWVVYGCNEKCDLGKWYGVAAALVFFCALVSYLILWWREEQGRKRDFLLLVGLWFLVTFILFIPLSYGFAPRFFLLSGLIFPIFLGFLFLQLGRLCGSQRIGRILALFVVGFCVVSNLDTVSGRYSELGRASTEAIDSAPDRILKDRIRVTLAQQNEIVDMFERRYEAGKYPVYMFSEPQYRRALKYLMERRGIENAVLGFDGIYQEGVYFLVLRAQSDLEDALRKYRAAYTVGETTSFGTLVAIELFPKPEAIQAKRQDFSVVKPSGDSKAPPRYTWREFFSRQQQGSDAESALDEAEGLEEDNSL